MSKRYRLSDPAQLDAEDLFDYIAAADFETALRIESELFDTLTLLA